MSRGEPHTCMGSSSKGGGRESPHKIPEPQQGLASQSWGVLDTQSPFKRTGFPRTHTDLGPSPSPQPGGHFPLLQGSPQLPPSSWAP